MGEAETQEIENVQMESDRVQQDQGVIIPDNSKEEDEQLGQIVQQISSEGPNNDGDAQKYIQQMIAGVTQQIHNESSEMKQAVKDQEENQEENQDDLAELNQPVEEIFEDGQNINDLIELEDQL